MRTAIAAPPITGPVAVRFITDPPGAEQLGIVEAHGRRPAARLEEVLAQLMDQVAALGRQHDMPVLDTYTLLDEDMFIDSFHVNRLGAAIYSEKLARELLVPLRDRKERPCARP